MIYIQKKDNKMGHLDMDLNNKSESINKKKISVIFFNFILKSKPKFTQTKHLKKYFLIIKKKFNFI